MDYIIASSIRGLKPLRLVLSYDIACSWRVNAPKRLASLPDSISVDTNSLFMEEVVPKFHLNAHGTKCRSLLSLNWRKHMARTDGENIERGWAWMNPVALSTCEMGEGSRKDTLDNQWGVWNFGILRRMGTFTFRSGSSPTI